MDASMGDMKPATPVAVLLRRGGDEECGGWGRRRSGGS
jgi:hypothetical protein